MDLKVKVISANDFGELEKTINRFLTGKKEEEIFDIKYSTCAAAIPLGYGNGAEKEVAHSALIYYKE